MFSNKLPFSNDLFSIEIEKYAETHFLKSFEKKYKGKQWDLTLKSIFEDLSRLRIESNKTQNSNQIDELKHKGDYWLAKYDFRVAGTPMSPKTSGNRCVIFINNKLNKIKLLMIYGKTDLPKNMKETHFIYNTLDKIYNILNYFN